MHIHHAGIATDDAVELADQYADLLGADVAHQEEFEGMHVVFLAVANGYFELLEPLEDGTIAKYLDREGPGIHHVALATEDVDGALANARELGIRPIDEEPREGAWGHEVAFLHPESTGGVLLEFVES